MKKSVCEIKECPECGSTNLVCLENKEQLVCKDCGAIYEPPAVVKKKK